MRRTHLTGLDTFLTEGTHDRDFRLRRDGNFDRVYFGSRVSPALPKLSLSSPVPSPSAAVFLRMCATSPAERSQIGFGRARPLLNTHSVKTRAYYGNTSMDAEMGFIMTSQTLVSTTQLNPNPAPDPLRYA
jgi:hypothetical protein